MITDMVTEIYNYFRNNHIRLKKGYIRGLSLLWWIVRVAQLAFVMFAFYAFFLGVWMIVG